MSGSHALLVEAAQRLCARRGLAFAALSHGWVLRLGQGRDARFVHGFALGLNSRLAALAADDKALCALMLAEVGLPHVPRRLVLSPALHGRLHHDGGAGWLEEARNAVAEMAALGEGGAVVVKPNRGRSGMDVWRCCDTREALRRLGEVAARQADGAACVEPFLPAERECRFVVLDGTIELAFAKVAGESAKSFALHNLSRDGRIAPLAPQEEALGEMALAAAEALGLHFCTVDILAREEGPLVLEANANVTLGRAAEALGRERIIAIYERVLEKLFADG